MCCGNHSKPYQEQWLRSCGLRAPDTLITNDPDAARAFYEEHAGEVIYRSVSGVRSIVRRVGPEQLARFPFLRHGPTQFQAFVPGDNVRVHTVGSDLFATRVRSTAVDYRYARQEGADVDMTAFELPPAVADACLRVAQGTIRLERRSPVFDPGKLPGPDPRIEQLIQSVAGLTQQVAQLTNQVEELRKRAQK